MILKSKRVMIDEDIRPATLFIENGYIAKIEEYKDNNEALDLKDYLIAPGIVDLHCDALEKEIEPRPRAKFPTEFAIKNLDKKLAMAGITTMFHAIAFENNPDKQRYSNEAREQIELFHKLEKELSVDNFIHARFELSSSESFDALYECMDKKLIHMLSLMDHSPGQGQFKSFEALSQYYKKHHGYSDEQIKVLADKMQNKNLDLAEKLVKKAKEENLSLLSHDDDCREKLELLLKWGIKICEFPLSLEIAKYAIEKGNATGMGAPNIVRGKSQSGNIAAIELVRAGVCGYLCSDYHPNSMLLSVFKIAKENPEISLSKAYAMISKNPACYANLNDRGIIKEGLKADLLVIDEGSVPTVLWTIKEGLSVYGNLKSFEFKKSS